MKNLLAILAVAIIGSAFAFAVPPTPGPVTATNIFTIGVDCPTTEISNSAETFTADLDLGDIYADGISQPAVGEAKFTVKNWGTDGKWGYKVTKKYVAVQADPTALPSPIAEVLATGLSVADTWTVTGASAITGTVTGYSYYNFTSTACNTTAILDLNITTAIAAVDMAHQDYYVVYTVDITETN